MGLFGAICQSCSMPISKDEAKGTEKDGSLSRDYCNNCYKAGTFTQPDLAMDEMTVIVRSKMAEMGVPKIFARMFSRKIPKLKRWRRG